MLPIKMAAFTVLRTRCSLFVRVPRLSNPSVHQASSIHLYAASQRGRMKHVSVRYESGTLPRRDHALTSSLSAVGAEKALKHPLSIRILPYKPHHVYQKKELEIRDIQARFDKLKKDRGVNCVLGVYIEGGPASGKTQLAREFGEWYFKQLTDARNNGGSTGDKAVVATIDARTPASFLRSYLRLAEDLGFPLSRYNMPGDIREHVRLISIDVQKALAETAPNWLLIIDEIDPGSKLAIMHFHFVGPLIPCSSKHVGFRKFHLSLPHPGSDDWGEGQLLVTTRHRSILYRNTCAMHYVMPPMSEANAVSLLYKVSGYEGEGAEDVVNSHHVGTLPLNVARWA